MKVWPIMVWYLCFGGISSRWKQTVAYYFPSDSVRGYTFMAIIDEIISRAESLGIHVHSITSDMGPSNKYFMWTSYGVHCKSNGNVKNSIPHPFEPERYLYFMADVSHLLKNIKQSLFNNTFITIPDDIMIKNNLTSNIVDYKHIEQLANHQDDLELKLVHKINVNDFKKPNHFDKIKVSKSKIILSTDVSTSLQYLVENEGYQSSYNTTAWSVKQVAKWFTLNSK